MPTCYFVSAMAYKLGADSKAEVADRNLLSISPLRNSRPVGCCKRLVIAVAELWSAMVLSLALLSISLLPALMS